MPANPDTKKSKAAHQYMTDTGGFDVFKLFPLKSNSLSHLLITLQNYIFLIHLFGLDVNGKDTRKTMISLDYRITPP